LLLAGVVFAIGLVRSFFSAERARALLSDRRHAGGNVLAAGLGVVTPFCSCSAVPLFIGFVTAGVPIGVTFSFLIAAPMVNEIALALLLGLFGWKIALLYLTTGLAIAIGAGWLIGRIGVEPHIEPWVWELPTPGDSPDFRLTWEQRLDGAIDIVREIVGKVWIWVLVGIAAGSAIHGYVPQDFFAFILGGEVWWSVPVAVLIGIPMYSNAAGIIPIVEALLSKGASLGSALAFMMSVIALSLPEMIILRKVLRPRLIALFIAVVAVGILAVGYVFNLLL
ncbi:MAG: permease, partial [Thermoanaerobaculia bacterium]|nr:permease [Thermoanaerobaculia bacterium]